MLNDVVRESVLPSCWYRKYKANRTMGKSRQRCTRHARAILSRNEIANQERLFWEIHQSYC